MTQRFATDLLIIGGGAAGLSTALSLASDARVTVLCKDRTEAGRNKDTHQFRRTTNIKVVSPIGWEQVFG